MIYTYTITEDLLVNVYIDGQLVDYPGPWADHAAAEEWATEIMAALESGEIIYPQQETEND